MAKKEAQTKRVSINKFEDICKEEKTIIHKSISDGDILLEFDITLKLSFIDSCRFVNEVVNEICNAYDDFYLPEAKDAVLRRCILSFYANIATPDDVVRYHEMIYSENGLKITEMILAEIEADDAGSIQFKSILKAIDEKVDHNRNLILSSVRKNINELIAQNASISEQMENAVNTFKTSLDGIDVGKLSQSVDAFSKLDEKKIVQFVNDSAQKPSL